VNSQPGSDSFQRRPEYLGFLPPGSSAQQMAEVIRQHLSKPDDR
jgi:hypothetical protein